MVIPSPGTSTVSALGQQSQHGQEIKGGRGAPTRLPWGGIGGNTCVVCVFQESYYKVSMFVFQGAPSMQIFGLSAVARCQPFTHQPHVTYLPQIQYRAGRAAEPKAG